MTAGLSLLDLALPAPSTVTIVDVGAALTERPRHAALLERGVARVVGFEPDPAARRALAAKFKNHVILPHVLADGRRHSFQHCRYPGCSSLLEPDPSVVDAFSTLGAFEGGNFEVLRRETVDTVRLDDVAEARDCDFVKVDVQGAELMVLENARDTLAHALVVETEVEFLPLYQDQPLFAEVDGFLRGEGFLLHKLADVAGRPFRPIRMHGNLAQPMSQILWADAVFVRDFRTLDGLPDDRLLTLALLLNDVYGSVDLCAAVLAMVGRRLGQPLDSLYLKAVDAHGAVAPSLVNIKDWTD